MKIPRLLMIERDGSFNTQEVTECDKIPRLLSSGQSCQGGCLALEEIVLCHGEENMVAEINGREDENSTKFEEKT